MGHQCRRFEKIQVFKYHPDGRRLVGSIGWDSGSCQVWGTLGVQYEQRGLKGKARRVRRGPWADPFSIRI